MLLFHGVLNTKPKSVCELSCAVPSMKCCVQGLKSGLIKSQILMQHINDYLGLLDHEQKRILDLYVQIFDRSDSEWNHRFGTGVCSMRACSTTDPCTTTINCVVHMRPDEPIEFYRVHGPRPATLTGDTQTEPVDVDEDESGPCEAIAVCASSIVLRDVGMDWENCALTRPDEVLDAIDAELAKGH